MATDAERRITDFDFRIAGTPEEERERRLKLDERVKRLASEVSDEDFIAEEESGG